MSEGAARRFGKALEAERNASKETVRAYLREIRSLRDHRRPTSPPDIREPLLVSSGFRLDATFDPFRLS